MTLSRSKNLEDGILFARKVSRPFRSSLGRNHVAHKGTTLGEVEILEGGLFLSASASSAGVTRYEEKSRCDNMPKAVLRRLWSDT